MPISRRGKELTFKQQKEYILEITGWTSEQYNKQYDKFRNQARTYEKAVSLNEPIKEIATLFARKVRADVRIAEGKPAYYSQQLQAIIATPSYGTGGKVKIDTQTGEVIRTYRTAEEIRTTRAARKMGVAETLETYVLEKLKTAFKAMLAKSQIAAQMVEEWEGTDKKSRPPIGELQRRLAEYGDELDRRNKLWHAATTPGQRAALGDKSP